MPPKIKRLISKESLDEAIEIVLDIGRIPEVRIGNGKIAYLGCDTVVSDDINYIVEKYRSLHLITAQGLQEHCIE